MLLLVVTSACETKVISANVRTIRCMGFCKACVHAETLACTLQAFLKPALHTHQDPGRHHIICASHFVGACHPQLCASLNAWVHFACVRRPLGSPALVWLTELGLAQYGPAFEASGFGDWQVLGLLEGEPGATSHARHYITTAWPATFLTQ